MKKPPRNQGATLVVALIVILVITAAIGIAVSSTSTTSILTDRSRDLVETRLVAEGAIEYAFGIWKARVKSQDRPVTTKEANTNLSAPSFSGYSYDSTAPLQILATDEYGTPLGSKDARPVSVSTSLKNYPGWSGKTYNYVAAVRVTQSSSRGTPVTAGVKRLFQYVSVPLFQSMFFYQDDLEMYKPAPMTIGGLVHTNANLYISTGVSSTLTFQNAVSYVGSSYLGSGGTVNTSGNTPPPDAHLWSGYSSSDVMFAPVYSAGVQVTQVDPSYPLGQDASNILDTTDANPNNDSFHELIEPPDSSDTDPTEIANRRMYNQAGIIVSISGTTATVTTQNGTSLTDSQKTAIQSAVTSKTTIYDQREGKSVDVANINVETLTPVLNTASASGGFNGILYIQDATAVSSSSPNAKTIRLQNGGVLPDDGLTIASQNPVYVQGDYNTGTDASSPSSSVPANLTGNPLNTDSPTVPGYARKPAAIMADAIMLLSNAWDDANSSKSLSSRQASNTTYNMAMLSGVMPSGYTPETGDPHYGAAAYGYSGGANNYPRLLENWSARTCTYYGSMVELFASKTFTGAWDTGNIYSPPARRWNFDTNFVDNPPPGSLNAVTMTRGSWQKF